MKFIWRLIPWLTALAATLVIAILGGGFGAYYYLQPALPSVQEMRDIQLQIPLRIYSRDGRLIQQIGEKRRTPVDYEDIPKMVEQAFLAAEDDRFFEHPGFDYQGIMRAAILFLTTGSRAQGGSTITQQLARGYFLSRDRTFVRKAKEIILAIQIEKAFTKQEILALYLNKIFLGQRSYGVTAAAETYFGKKLDELSIAETATIAALPAAPSAYNPVTDPDKARDRRSYVLRRMNELGFISDDELKTAMMTPVESHLHGPQVDLEAPYVAEMARSKAVQLLGEDVYVKGYKVITTIDSRQQRAANSALRKALLKYDRRHGFRGPVASIDIEQATNDYLNRDRDEAIQTAEAMLSSTEQTDIALQSALSDYPVYTDLSVGVVTELSPDNTQDGAQVYLRDAGRVTVPWERLKWSRYVNDNVIGDAPGGVADLLTVGDVVYLLDTQTGWQLAQLPESQGAFVALDPHDGATTALTGGFDYYSSKFNRAVQTRRQPGSSFKPFIYSAALDNGFTAATIVNDAPVVVDGSGQEEAWRPENYSNRFYGPTRLREGLVRSMNLVSVRVLREVGMRRALNHLRPFGFPSSALPRDLSLALGSGGASPWQLAEAFSGLASGGNAVERYYIDRIIDTDGNIVYAAEPRMTCTPCAPLWAEGREPGKTPEPELPAFALNSDDIPPPVNDGDSFAAEVPNYESVEQMIEHASEWRPDYRETPEFWEDRNQATRIISKQNAYIVYDMMHDVIERGTGRRARSLERRDLAGKTGTSNNRRDAWFSGFNSQLVGIAWVGFDDDSRSLGAGEEGSKTALPMWIDFMGIALADTDNAPLQQPPGIVTVRIDKETGKLASLDSADSLFEIFRAGNQPEAEQEVNGFDGGDVFVDDADDSSIF